MSMKNKNWQLRDNFEVQDQNTFDSTK